MIRKIHLGLPSNADRRLAGVGSNTSHGGSGACPPGCATKTWARSRSFSCRASGRKTLIINIKEIAMVARYVLNRAHIYSEEEKVEFLESAKRTAQEFAGIKLSQEAKALLRE